MGKHLYSWIGRLTIVMMSILLKVIYRMPMVFSVKTKKFILKLIWNLKGPWISKTILKKKDRVRDLMVPDFKPYFIKW